MKRSQCQQTLDEIRSYSMTLSESAKKCEGYIQNEIQNLHELLDIKKVDLINEINYILRRRQNTAHKQETIVSLDLRSSEQLRTLLGEAIEDIQNNYLLQTFAYISKRIDDFLLLPATAFDKKSVEFPAIDALGDVKNSLHNLSLQERDEELSFVTSPVKTTGSSFGFNFGSSGAKPSFHRRSLSKPCLNEENRGSTTTRLVRNLSQKHPIFVCSPTNRLGEDETIEGKSAPRKFSVPTLNTGDLTHTQLRPSSSRVPGGKSLSFVEASTTANDHDSWESVRFEDFSIIAEAPVKTKTSRLDESGKPKFRNSVTLYGGPHKTPGVLTARDSQMNNTITRSAEKGRQRTWSFGGHSTSKPQASPKVIIPEEFDSSSSTQTENSNPNLVGLLDKRTIVTVLQSSNEVKLQWNHSVVKDAHLRYSLEFSAGLKVNNIEQFRQLYQGASSTCIVTNLTPKTSYKFRVSPYNIKDDVEENGPWSECVEIKTFDIQCIDRGSISKSANVSLIKNESVVNFFKSGALLGRSPFLFGVHNWQVRIVSIPTQKFDTRNCSSYVQIGVGSKEHKGEDIVGPRISGQALRVGNKIKLEFNVGTRTLSVPGYEPFERIELASCYPVIKFHAGKGSSSAMKCIVQFAS
eukprot:CAMPEP_0114985692 /NCGR_PEP_ID=MMETSP0216-20121206/8010_1 /TAXON_ID=223996 /ORGANISM="Protocruzia adherens, Strain Boccale" /LENGTH=634 /DNA_ID=CAMNT_0002348041 /DNA_START=615 /DNA_END=2519 /DNA_ORIENTATION=+